VWLRLAMASFGVTTPLVSIVLSVFMAGLALGSWGAGRVSARWMRGAGAPLRFYAAAEMVIALSSVVVPVGFTWGRSVLSGHTLGVAWGSWAYYVVSGAWVAGALLPACIAMGATFPFAMAAMQRHHGTDARAFSFLYMANVLGATAGTLASAFVMIELLGFGDTARVAGLLNIALVLVAFGLARRATQSTATSMPQSTAMGRHGPEPAGPRITLVALFLTGLLSLGFEVIWIRQFAPHLGTDVYAFATVLAVYLAATFAGARVYRMWSSRGSGRAVWGWVVAGGAALLPLIAADFRLPIPAMARVVLGIGPFCAAVGYLTPKLVDGWTGGDPARAGLAYAMNVLGSIIGPLVAGFWLLPTFGERGALVILATPLLVLATLAIAMPGVDARPRRGLAIVVPLALVAGALVLIVTTKGVEAWLPQGHVRRDHTATVVAAEIRGTKVLLVNGHSTTVLAWTTKMMAHLPLAMLESPPRDALVICFGMGTTFRSALTWGINATVVELIPSVPKLFGFFHSDAAAVLASPRARVVVDDGRRFLERSTQTWDVITLDPPYPVELAGSGLLYAKEFYTAARRRLRPEGLVHQWLPRTEPAITAAVAKAIRDSFPYVRVFALLDTGGRVEGFFFIAGLAPMPRRTPAVVAGRLPAAAATDLVEWAPQWTPEYPFKRVMSNEVPIDAVVAVAPSAPVLEDDRPVNEYFLVRRWLH
jgi:spermidine synthase